MSTEDFIPTSLSQSLDIDFLDSDIKRDTLPPWSPCSGGGFPYESCRILNVDYSLLVVSTLTTSSSSPSVLSSPDGKILTSRHR